MGSQLCTHNVITSTMKTQSVIVILVSALCSVQPQSPFPAIPGSVSVSPLSLLGNIWSSVQRSRGLTSLFHPHQIKSKLAGDINNGVHNFYPQIIKFPYPRHHVRDHNYPGVGSPLSLVSFPTISAEPSPAPSIISSQVTSFVELDTTTESTATSQKEHLRKVPEKNDDSKKGTVLKKIRKLKKSLIPNPKYAAEEFTYVPDAETDNDSDTEYSDNSIGNYTATPKIIENFENLRNLNFKLVEDTKDDTNKKYPNGFQINRNIVKPYSFEKCAKLHETGYCDNSISSDYYQQMFDSLLENCADVLSAFKAFVPEDIDSLGDNSESVIRSEKDQDRPWSWTVSAYKKKQVCQSDLSFIRPSYVLNTKGEPHIVIQTKEIKQSVSVDSCSRPGSPCPGLGQCDIRSLCVQRYQHQYLLSIPDTEHTNNSITKCQAVITAVKFPSGCVCHAQTSEVDNDFGFGDKLV